MKALMDVFRFQVPIELHENALYACLNLMQDCNKAQKMQLLNFGLLKSIMKFLADMYEIEYEVLQPYQPEKQDFITVFIDYELQWNPKFSSTKIKKDKDLTIDEMQEKIINHKIYIWKSEEEGTFRVDPRNPFNQKKVTGSESVIKEKIIEHIQSLRAIGYSVINIIQMGNTKLLYEILKNLYPAMLQNLRDDLMKSIMICSDKHGFTDARLLKLSSLPNAAQSEELSHTALDLFCNIITIKELYRYANSIGIDLPFIEKLYNFL